MSFSDINSQEMYSLTIKVTHLRNSKGTLQIALYNKKGTIPDEKFQKFYKKEAVQITENTAILTFTHLPKGIYAVNVLHDENKNGKIDKGFMLPKEGIGFSNYAKIGFRNRPKFSKASFELTKDVEKEIKVIYF